MVVPPFLPLLPTVGRRVRGGRWAEGRGHSSDVPMGWGWGCAPAGRRDGTGMAQGSFPALLTARGLLFHVWKRRTEVLLYSQSGLQRTDHGKDEEQGWSQMKTQELGSSLGHAEDWAGSVAMLG